MTEQEIRINAAIQELAAQLRAAHDRCMNLAAEVAVLQNKLKEKDAVPADSPPNS